MGFLFDPILDMKRKRFQLHFLMRKGRYGETEFPKEERKGWGKDFVSPSDVPLDLYCPLPHQYQSSETEEDQTPVLMDGRVTTVALWVCVSREE